MVAEIDWDWEGQEEKLNYLREWLKQVEKKVEDVEYYLNDETSSQQKTISELKQSLEQLESRVTMLAEKLHSLDTTIYNRFHNTKNY